MGVKALMIVLLCAGLAASQSTVPSTTKAADPPTTKATAPPTTKATAPPTNPPTTKATNPPTTKATTPATTQPPTTKPTTPASTKAPTTKATTPSTTKAPTTKPTTPSTTKVPTTKPTTPSTTKAPTTKPTTPSTTKAPTTKPTTPSTTKAPTTKPTTPATTKAPTTKPTTPATTKAPTTKPTTPATTQAPTTKPTTPATTKPTTAEPTTKPTAPATTKAPTAPPVPPVPHYDVKDNGTVCIRVQGEMNFTVPYKSNSSAAYHNKVTFAVPASAVASGSCFGVNKTTASVSLSWAKGLATFTLGFNMMKDGSWGTASMNYNFSTANPVFVLPIDNPQFIAGGLKKGADLKMYHATKGHSYQCDREEDVSLENDVVVSFANLQMQPLKLNGGKFNDADVCPKKTDDNSTSSIVPIAVGCALAGLIVIVLIAYLVGRRRGNRGYQQV